MNKCENCKEIVKEYEEFLDDYKKEQRELVRQEVLGKINKYHDGDKSCKCFVCKLKKELSA